MTDGRQSAGAVFASLALAAAVIAVLISIPYSFSNLRMALQSGATYLLYGVIGHVFLAWIIALLHAVVLALPVFHFLRRRNWFNGWSAAAAGFATACTPAALWFAIGSRRGSTLKLGSPGEMVTAIVDGVPTLAGWLYVARGLAELGLFGAIGGLVFWTVLRRLSPRTAIN